MLRIESLEPRQLLAATLSIVDEVHVFNRGTSVALTMAGAVPSSVVLTSSGDSMVYVAGADYSVNAFPGRVEICRLIGGRIEDGQRVLVDYQITTQRSVADYFPLYNGAWWSYAGTYEHDSVTVARTCNKNYYIAGAFDLNDNAETENDQDDPIAARSGMTYRCGTDGLWLYRITGWVGGADATVTLDKPVQLLTANLAAPTPSINIPLTASLGMSSPWSIPGAGRGTLTTRIEGLERFTLPDGRYIDAVLRVSFDVAFGLGGSFTGQSWSISGNATETMWLAPGVGVVKETVHADARTTAGSVPVGGVIYAHWSLIDSSLVPVDQVSLRDGMLRVYGTKFGDDIRLTTGGVNAGTMIVTTGGVSKAFNRSDAKGIVIATGSGKDRVEIGAGVPALYVDAGTDNDFLIGGDFSDTLTGGAGKDTIYGGAGDDRLNGNGGHDCLIGDVGNDRMYGGNENDTIEGCSGVDRIWAGLGDDVLAGGGSNDRLFGDDGNDILTGGTQNDWLFGGAGKDALYGGAGDDDLHCGDGDDYARGDAGEDVIRGDAGSDLLDCLDKEHDHVYRGAGDTKKIDPLDEVLDE